MDRFLVRSMMFRLAFVVVFMAVARELSHSRAHAAGESGAPLRASAALFPPTRTDAGLTWSARWTLPPDAVNDFADGAPRILRFAVPLLEGESFDAAAGLSPVLEGG